MVMRRRKKEQVAGTCSIRSAELGKGRRDLCGLFWNMKGKRIEEVGEMELRMKRGWFVREREEEKA